MCSTENKRDNIVELFSQLSPEFQAEIINLMKAMLAENEK